MVVSGNATATAHNILTSETLYRVSIVLLLVAAVVFILLVRALYSLLSGVSRSQAWSMVTFALVSIPISFVGALFQFAAVTFMRGASFRSEFNQSQLDAAGMASSTCPRSWPMWTRSSLASGFCPLALWCMRQVSFPDPSGPC